MTRDEFEVVHPTEKEKTAIWKQNFKEWGGDLTGMFALDPIISPASSDQRYISRLASH
jgi:hypothetical protein